MHKKRGFVDTSRVQPVVVVVVVVPLNVDWLVDYEYSVPRRLVL